MEQHTQLWVLRPRRTQAEEGARRKLPLQRRKYSKRIHPRNWGSTTEHQQSKGDHIEKELVSWKRL